MAVSKRGKKRLWVMNDGKTHKLISEKAKTRKAAGGYLFQSTLCILRIRYGWNQQWTGSGVYAVSQPLYGRIG